MKLSPIILGTMRFGLKQLDATSVAELITAAQGIDCSVLHVSSEYDSHSLLVDALQKLSGKDLKRCRFMVKLASPHFGEHSFDAKSLECKIDAYRKELNCDSLAMVQWMWRSESSDDDARCASFLEQSEEICDCFAYLVSVGKVEAFSCFPYSAHFMQQARDADVTGTQVNYLNLFESAATDAGIGESTIVLRPYAGGRVFKDKIKKMTNDIADQFPTIEMEDLPRLSIQFPFLHPHISSVVVSCSRIEELEACREVQRNTAIDIDGFVAIQELQKKIIKVVDGYGN